MSSVNRVQILGNVGQEPEIRPMQNGGKVATLSVATSESWTDKGSGEKKEVTEWHRVTVFGDGLVGVVEKYVKKGSKVYIDGRLKTRKWQDQSGADRYTTEIVVSGPGTSLVLCGDRSGGGNKAPPADSAESYRNARSGNAPPPRNDMDDEIPF